MSARFIKCVKSCTALTITLQQSCSLIARYMCSQYMDECKPVRKSITEIPCALVCLSIIEAHWLKCQEEQSPETEEPCCAS